MRVGVFCNMCALVWKIVKSADRYNTKSLERFIEKYKERIGMAYVIHPKNLKVTDDILYIPAYMIMCLE